MEYETLENVPLLVELESFKQPTTHNPTLVHIWHEAKQIAASKHTCCLVCCYSGTSEKRTLQIKDTSLLHLVLLHTTVHKCNKGQFKCPQNVPYSDDGFCLSTCETKRVYHKLLYLKVILKLKNHRVKSTEAVWKKWKIFAGGLPIANNWNNNYCRGRGRLTLTV